MTSTLGPAAGPLKEPPAPDSQTLCEPLLPTKKLHYRVKFKVEPQDVNIKVLQLCLRTPFN